MPTQKEGLDKAREWIKRVEKEELPPSNYCVGENGPCSCSPRVPHPFDLPVDLSDDGEDDEDDEPPKNGA